MKRLITLRIVGLLCILGAIWLGCWLEYIMPHDAWYTVPTMASCIATPMCIGMALIVSSLDD